MQTLADNGGYVLTEDGDRLLFFRRRILPSWLAFVPGLLCVIAIGNAVAQLALGHLVAAGVLAVVGAGGGRFAWAVRGRRRRVRARPLDPTDATVVVDLGARSLVDGTGQVLAPLDLVRVERSVQMTSSSRALRVVWPGGAVVVFRGDALSLTGSIEAPTEALRTRGIPIA
jgi:hypothetical protein